MVLNRICVLGCGSAGKRIVGSWRRARGKTGDGIQYGFKGSWPEKGTLVVVAGLGGEVAVTEAIGVLERARTRGLEAKALVVMPFHFEGECRRKKALRDLEVLRSMVRQVLVFENNALVEADASWSLKQAYRVANAWLWQELGRMCGRKEEKG